MVFSSKTEPHLPMDPGFLSIHSDQVHVWHISLDVSENHSADLLSLLSADEVARAARFHFVKDQSRFIAARGILRKILGQYLGQAPQQLRFSYSPYGKPQLLTEAGHEALRFNLSHSGSFALCALSYGRDIGIDMERIRADLAVDQMIRRFFAPAEIRLLEQMEENTRLEAFFQYWTRKEAVLKALGEGVSFPMEQCDVSSIGGAVFLQIALGNQSADPRVWQVQDLMLEAGYASAIAVEGGVGSLSCLYFRF